MFGNNNRNEQINTNTTFTPMYSSLSMLTIGAWNDKISLKFVPCTGKDDNGLNTYDRDKRVSTAISQENAAILYEKVKTEILPHLTAKDDVEKNVGVPIGDRESQNVLVIARKKDDEGNMRMYLTFYKGIGADGKSTSATTEVGYLFSQGSDVVDFDPVTGSGTEEIMDAQFMNFYGILKNHSDILPLAAHGIQHRENVAKKYSGNNFGGPSLPQQPSGNQSGGFMDIPEMPFM